MNLPQVKTKTILLGGGLDLESPMMAVGEGFALELDNFEANLMGGYRRILGYERVDGRAAPTAAIYYTMQVESAEFMELDDVITGSVSGATAVIVAIDFTQNIIGITALTGSFEVGEVVGVTTVTVPQSANNYPDAKISAQWELAAQNYYRDLIEPVPGVGPVLGAWHWLGKHYAFRSNGTVVKMHESSTAGWVEIDMYSLLQWDGGVLNEGDVSEGDTLTGATSGATATVKKLVKVSGSYGTDAVGYAVIDVTSGAFEDNENIEKGVDVVFIANGADEAISFALGENHFEFVNNNFSGASDTYYMYGCDGVNRAFQWDGELVTPIVTGMVDDAPTHIEAHTNHLMLSFGSSVQNSATQLPLVFNAILGAAELATGEDIQGMKSVAGDALLISTNRGVHGLYGQNVDNWQLQRVSVDSGDAGNTLDVIGAPMMVTRRGVMRIDQSDRFGNFESSTVSRRINPLLRSWLEIKNVIGALIIRDKNQYRIFFNDGTGIILSSDQLFGDQGLPQFTTFSLPVQPYCVNSIATRGGNEVALIGAEDGYVYQLERGYSFDGEAIQYAARLPFHHLGSPMVRKSFKWLDIESDVERTADLRVTYEYSDGASHTAVSPIREYEFQGGSRAYWDEANWDEFNWNDEIVSRENLSMNGTGHNVSVLFFGISAVTAPFTINAITYQYLLRRLRRG